MLGSREAQQETAPPRRDLVNKNARSAEPGTNNDFNTKALPPVKTGRLKCIATVNVCVLREIELQRSVM